MDRPICRPLAARHKTSAREVSSAGWRRERVSRSSSMRSACCVPTYPSLFFLMLLPPPRSTLFPYTTLFRSSILRPLLRKLVTTALDHLDQGWLYTMAIPRREVRLRLACMWPILFAGATLQLVSTSSDLLDPTVTLKISKGQVYRIMALTTLTGGCGLVGTAYWARLRKGLR